MKRNKTSIYLIVIFSLALFIGIGYAFLSSNLNVLGNTTINKASWDIHLENLNITKGSVTATTEASIDTSKTSVNFGVKLSKPGEYYEFTVDEVNKGTIDAMVSSVVKTGLTAEQEKYLNYTVTYNSGVEVSEKQLLKSNDTEKILVRVEFKSDVVASDLPVNGATLNLSFSINYQQREANAIAVEHTVCKRATTLHTEICNQTDEVYYCSGGGYTTGETITYGNFGTKGALTSGDAFDCDVNGDGTYDSETERFYYVSGKDGDNSSNYATLIYYNNVSEGLPSNTKAYAYDTSTVSDLETYVEPNVAKLQLPTTEQWSNVRLSNTTRDILDEKGTVRVSDFSYAGYSARLLTVQEISKACGVTVPTWKDGELDSCKYLMENTQYSNPKLRVAYWLENMRYRSSASSVVAWDVGSNNRRAGNYIVSNTGSLGVRPAIEVEKSRISY